MDALISNLNLYDIFARLFVGMMTIITAEFLGIIDWISVKGNEASPDIVLVIVVSYFLGLILEELSYWADRTLNKTIEKKYIHKADKHYRAVLDMNGYGHLIESALTQAVISMSLMLSYAIFAMILLWNRLIQPGCIRGNEWSCKKNLFVLLVLFLVFYIRRIHYIKRRHELTKRYYEAYVEMKKQK